MDFEHVRIINLIQEGLSEVKYMVEYRMVLYFFVKKYNIIGITFEQKISQRTTIQHRLHLMVSYDIIN